MPRVMKRAAVRKKNLKRAHVVMVVNEARVMVVDYGTDVLLVNALIYNNATHSTTQLNTQGF